MYDEIASELGEEMAGPKPSEGFEYQSAEGSFAREKLGRAARAVYEALVAAGATKFRVRYDGGYDEGFSHPDAVTFAGRERSIEEVAAELGRGGALSKKLRETAGKDSSWGNAAELYGGASDEQTITYALDELAHELASKLLGDGYGTGEYQLYGAFTADLGSGEIVDHEDAEKPLEME